MAAKMEVCEEKVRQAKEKNLSKEGKSAVWQARGHKNKLESKSYQQCSQHGRNIHVAADMCKRVCNFMDTHVHKSTVMCTAK